MGRSKNARPKRRSDFTVLDESSSLSLSSSLTCSSSTTQREATNDPITTVPPPPPSTPPQLPEQLLDLETKSKSNNATSNKKRKRRLVRLADKLPNGKEKEKHESPNNVNGDEDDSEDDVTLWNQKDLGLEFNKEQTNEKEDKNNDGNVGKTTSTKSTTVEEPLTLPELTIESLSSRGDSFILRICSTQNNNAPLSSSATTYHEEAFCMDNVYQHRHVLQRYHLNGTTLEIFPQRTKNNKDDDSENDDEHDNNVSPTMPITIQSYEGALTLIHHCIKSCYNEEGLSYMQQEDIETIAMAVQDKTIGVELKEVCNNDNVIHVNLYVTKKSYLLCSPGMLPITSQASRIARSNKYQPIIRFHQGLVAILSQQESSSILGKVMRFPKYSTSSTLGNKQKKNNEAITAKMVYDVIDNVKLNEYYDAKEAYTNENDNDNEPMKIKGLVPTLRPYQKAAVQWMLRRETGKDTAEFSRNCNEWEMAWFVVTTCDNTQTEDDSCKVVQAKCVPLPEWKNSTKDTNTSLLIFFSPSVGWLAQTYEEARNYTIQDVVPTWNPSIQHHPPIVSGGILAESMGLGKTVEVLACILANPCHLNEQETKIFTKFATFSSASSTGKMFLGKEVEFKEEKKQDDYKDDNTTISYAPPVDNIDNHDNKEDNEMDITSQDKVVDCIHHLGECICGRSSKFKNCLSSVVCDKCLEPMHGLCAGFASEAEINAETKIRAIFVNGIRIVCRVCTYDRCPCCVAGQCTTGSLSNHGKQNLIESRATLIVTPPAILNQWEREIRRHTVIPKSNADSSVPYSIEVDSPAIGASASSMSTKPLRVVVYPGVRELSQSVGNPNSRRARGVEQGSLSTERTGIHLIHPKVLADADIVLMTFNALMQDLGHSSDNPFVAASSSETGSGRRNLRRRKRYRVVPSPLTSIKFWRVCLDEAQRIEAPTAASAKMALKLQCQHRWCVSGTPIGKGKLEDLYGLLLFLGVVPYCSRVWFTNTLRPSYPDVMERVKHLLHNIFWRSTKASAKVREQMGIPEQVERKVVLQFSSIERHFYDRQREETMLAASKVVGVDVEKRKSSQTALLVSQLHKLRAACCHPQVGSHGIGHNMRRGHNARYGGDGYNAVSIGSRVLSMEQILHRLIDDARIKCEEAQRFAVMHTNALACLAKLKIEAKAQHLLQVTDDDESLLVRSCREYMESLALTENNAKPTLVLGEANLSGCSGFRSSKKMMKDGRAILDWQMKVHEDSSSQMSPNLREVWSRIDFEGPSKRLIGVKVRPICSIPSDLSEGNGLWRLLEPKDCILQVSNSSVGGEFVNVVSFTLPQRGIDSIDENDWKSFGGFRTNKSKSWRLLVKNYHQDSPSSMIASSVQAYFIGVEIQLLESDIAVDNLQRLHTLHNTTLALTSLQQLRQVSDDTAAKTNCLTIGGQSLDISSSACIEEKIKSMQMECAKLESLYMDAARTVHKESQRQLYEASKIRGQHEADLSKMTIRVKPSHKRTGVKTENSFWADSWWDDLLSTCFLKGSLQERVSLCDTVGEEINDFYTDTLAGQSSRKRFPSFHDVDGLRVALGIYIEEVGASTASHALQIESVRKLCPHPTEAEIFENSHCGNCRADWHQTGPTCSHCKLDKALEKLENDPLLGLVLSAMSKWVKDLRPSQALGSALAAARVHERANKFLDILKSTEKERRVARVAWRTHFDLLSDIDELNQCKQTMRLVQEGEDVTKLSEEELNFIVAPWDLASKVMEHEAKQAMSLADLRRSKDTLRYLKNQNVDQQNKSDTGSKEGNEDDSANCMVCLSAFKGERAVLRCGHSFHYSPCLENLMKRSGNLQVIRCPLRCTVQTKRDEVMIATNKRKDDGSKTDRTLKGSWGTKVTRLVSDVMDVSDLGEKSIVFSQWEDMLEVVEQALDMNKITYVRAKSLARIGEALKKFRSNECTVLLLNVKNGAEGLTLVEATHVFMVEPLLNCGLDNQAINRIHRIGQTCKTFVHRYLIDDTIEIKIDKMRVERQEDQLEDAIQDTKKKHDFSAGGIDGGFSTSELEEVLKDDN